MLAEQTNPYRFYLAYYEWRNVDYISVDKGPPALALRTSRRTLSLSVSLTVTLLSVKPLSIQVLIAVPDSLCYQMHSMSSTSMSMAYHDNSRGPEP